ncbi:EutG Alcohol dehydrogenase, class IV [Candidatus Pelagibacterales bacterium]
MNHVLENKLNLFMKKRKIKNILVITGQKSFNFTGFKKLEIYRKFKSKMTILYKKNEIPEIQELEYLIKKINIINPDLIIALGGGCVIDYAKLANGLYNIKNLRKKIKSSTLKINSKKTKILAIPTTAGSGAEVTKFSVIYIDKIKYSVEHNLLKPDFFSLIPKLVLNSPKIVRSSSGFDTIAQASESIFSKKANILSLKYSSKSLRFSIKSYLEFVNRPNLKNAAQMLKAANFSGMAINIARTNAPHALSYFFSSKLKIPHGIAVSIFFVEIINSYYQYTRKVKNKNLCKKFKFLFNSTNIKNIKNFNTLFAKFFYESGIDKYLNGILPRVNLKKKLKFHYNLDRLKNSPFQINKEFINNLLISKKFHFIELF